MLRFDFNIINDREKEQRDPLNSNKEDLILEIIRDKAENLPLPYYIGKVPKGFKLTKGKEITEFGKYQYKVEVVGNLDNQRLKEFTFFSFIPLQK